MNLYVSERSGAQVSKFNKL